MDPRILHGIALFNSRQYFVCHEVLEEVWTLERGPRRLFLQSLIHFAVGMYHWECGNPVGASRQLHKCLRKLEAYLPEYEGIHTERLDAEAQTALEHVEAGTAVGQVPEIHLS